MPVALQEVDKAKVGFFRFKELNNQYLLTNDIGDYCFLDSSDLNAYLSGKIEQTRPNKYSELRDKGFIRDRLNFDSLSRRYASKNAPLGQGPGLHIVVVTLRCDHKCIYCQAGADGVDAKGLDMDIPVAKAVVDRIFESLNPNITIEFQGGEPLLNFKAIEFIVGYAQSKNKEKNKDLKFTVVSNLSFINPQIINFLIKNNIHICSSLDGPADIHNRQRIAPGKNSHKNTVKWLKVLTREFKDAGLPFRPSALVTVTSFSLKYPEKIVDEYARLGFDNVHLRAVTPFGVSAQAWNKVSYSAGDFIKFYIRAMNHILELNTAGRQMVERGAAVFLAKILTDAEPNYLDLRSPCGAGIGQIAYNFNGDAYTCDEGRMFSRRHDESFKIGNVSVNSHQEFINNPVVKAMCLASCLDNLAGCSQCVYKPYCGVCPLYNYSANGNIFNKVPFLCSINKGILDYLIVRLQEQKIKNIFLKWLVKDKGGADSEKN